MNVILGFISILCSFLATSCNGLILDLGGSLGINLDLLKQQNPQCNTTHINCPCGNDLISFEVPQCAKYHRFRTKCAPCNNMTPDKICPIFENCKECATQNGGRCSKCSSDKYGEFCENQCNCQNKGKCNIEGVCLCPNGFEGKYCEDKAGCDRPPMSSNGPLTADFRPPESPVTVIYSCQQEYELVGSSVISCLPDRQWSGPVPQCLKKCPPLSEPAKGYIKYNGSRLVEGTKAEVICYENHVIVGQRILTCTDNGSWDSQLPRCAELALCRDPGEVRYALKSTPSADFRSGSSYLQEAKIRFTCDPQFHLLGENQLTCTPNGTWNHELPSCIRVSSILPDCTSKASELVAAVGVPVRILCPPECAKSSKIWGTSIYRLNSTACAAAVHSGKITNSGGLVEIINNGDYNNFAGSYINNVQSQSYEEKDDSFRFNKVQPSKRSGNCAKGLQLVGQMCLLASNIRLPEGEAKATCSNMGFQLYSPDISRNQEKLIQFLEGKGISRIWIEQVSPSNQTEANSSQASEERKCEALTLTKSSVEQNFENCNRELPYICHQNETFSRLVSCLDPGNLENGIAKAVGKVDDIFYVGSSIEYQCDTLHYLKGAANIRCQFNGTWSDELPSCIKVDTCVDPPVPYGGFVNYLAPMKNSMAQRQAIIPTRTGPRAARLPVGLQSRPPRPTAVSTTTPEPEIEIELPPGRHRVGTRAMYDCESRYYNFIGSKLRRCEKGGQWSGRPPTCIPICGRSDSARSPFIVNGNASDIGQWPWQAGIARYLPDYELWYVLCGGSLLNERWVVTAAHCITYTGTTLPIDQDKFRVYIGKYHRSDSKDDEYVQIKSIKEFHIHPDYEPQVFDSDIALLQLDSPVQLNSRVQPVCLPTEAGSIQNLSPGTKGVVTGWGTNENGTHSDTLQQAVVPVISNRDCEKGYESAGMPLTVTENMFCAGYKEGHVDSCSGDSGGPLVFLDEASRERRWILEGIVSWGSPTGCGNADQYGGYTKVSNFLDWIHLFF